MGWPRKVATWDFLFWCPAIVRDPTLVSKSYEHHVKIFMYLLWPGHKLCPSISFCILSANCLRPLSFFYTYSFQLYWWDVKIGADMQCCIFQARRSIVVWHIDSDTNWIHFDGSSSIYHNFQNSFWVMLCQGDWVHHCQKHWVKCYWETLGLLHTELFSALALAITGHL